MRYNLGYMDMYLVEAAGSTIENNPLYKATFKTRIDPVRLEDAVYRAMKFHPLFGTQVRYDKEYYLETNNRPIILFHAEESKRPVNFGASTNGYPWQICWAWNSFTFEWCHCVTDGRGTLEFLKTVISIYCGVKYPVVPRKVNLGLGWEPFADKSYKGKGEPVQPAGFRRSALPPFKRGYQCDCHALSASTAEILSLAHDCGSSPSIVLSVLVSQAIRKHIPENVKNRNVASNVVIDLRKPLQYETMHNCDDFLRITYQDRHDEMKFRDICREQKEYLDKARNHENMIRMITERVDLLSMINIPPTKRMRCAAVALYGIIEKDRDCNCQITYVGKAEFPEEVYEQMEDFQLRSWPDFGECTIAGLDYKGKFNLTISENYMEKGIVEDFIQICAQHGIQWEYQGCRIYEQAHFVEEKKKMTRNGRSSEPAAEERKSVLPDPLGSLTNFL